jgi:hypothetical protein
LIGVEIESRAYVLAGKQQKVPARLEVFNSFCFSLRKGRDAPIPLARKRRLPHPRWCYP